MGNDSTQLEQRLEVSEQKQTNITRRVGAAVLSCFIPGSGEFLVGNARRGAIHLAFLIALIAMYWPLRLPRHYWALVLLVYWMFALWVVSAITALRTKRSPYLRASWWWLVLVLPILYGGANLAGWSLVRVSGLRPFQVPSNSMAPTIKERERLVADMRAFRNSPPKVGDLVVFRHNGILLVKRVVAVSGDVVAGDASGFTVNGKKPQRIAWGSAEAAVSRVNPGLTPGASTTSRILPTSLVLLFHRPPQLFPLLHTRNHFGN